MYNTLLVFHAFFRWLVLCALLLAIYKAYSGYSQNRLFSRTDNSIRHWTATIAHIQLVIGIILYVKSPITQYLWSNFNHAIKYTETAFFGLYHILLMLTAVVFVTIGSALAKRKSTDKVQFKTMFFWYSLALCIIFMAIPWPFSPFANRPYFRSF